MATTTKNMQVTAGNANASVTAQVTDSMPGVPCPGPGGYTYKGLRYVPVFADPIEWNSANSYEALTVVLHEGNSYTSKQAVPVGVDIMNTEFWVKTFDFNAQLEKVNSELNNLETEFTDLENSIQANKTKYMRVYSTVAEMLSDSEIVGGWRVMTLGYYSAEDGGAADYTITDSGIPSVGKVLECANGKYANLVEPKFGIPEVYGAKGDGASDDTAYLELAAQTGTMVLTSGKTYKSTLITLSNDLVVYGNGATVNCSSWLSTNYKLKVDGVTFTSISSGVPITINSANSEVTNCKFSGFDNYSVKGYNCNNLVVKNCYTSNGGCCLINGSNDVYNVTIDSCTVENGTTTWAYYFNSVDSAGEVRASTISNCLVNKTQKGGIFPGGYANQVQGCTVIQSGLDPTNPDPYGRAIWVHECDGVNVVNCVVQNCKAGISVINGKNCVIDNCLVNGINNYAIDVVYNNVPGRYPGDDGNSNLVIKGCTFEKGNASYDCIKIDGQKNVIIDSCSTFDKTFNLLLRTLNTKETVPSVILHNCFAGTISEDSIGDAVNGVISCSYVNNAGVWVTADA